MNTESLRNEVLVPAVAKTLDIAAKAKPTKEELFTTAKSLLLWQLQQLLYPWRYKQYYATDKT